MLFRSVSKVPEGWNISVSSSKDDSVMEWTVPSQLIVEPHGHSVALYAEDRSKRGEASISASGPVVVKEWDRAHLGESLNEHGQLIKITAKGPHKGMRVNIRDKNFKFQERGLVHADSPWRRWHAGERHLSYLLERPKSGAGKKRLVVVFSAIGNEYDFTYNYRSALSDADVYRLFILDDFGTRGSYYLADHKDTDIFRSVQAFLGEIICDLGVNQEDVTFAGSSKGGTAALIHGLTLKVGHIVAGAPQTKPGTYLGVNAEDMLQFIAGDKSDEGRIWLDSAVLAYLSQGCPNTQVSVLVGDVDHHLEAHVRPLEAILTSAGTPIRTLVVQGVSHQDIGRPFSLYLNRLQERRSGLTPDSLVPYELSWQGSEDSKAQLRVWIPSGEVIAVRVFSGRNLVAEYGYSDKDYYSINVPVDERVRVRIYRKSSASRLRKSAFTTEWLRARAV